MQSENMLDADLLIEFLTEELPPINLEKNIGEAFTTTLCQEIKGFLPPERLTEAGNFGQNPHHFSIAELFITPRRFGCLIKQVRVREPEQKLLRKGPAIATALNNGEPTPALLGFAKACGLAWQDLEQRGDGYFYAQQTVPGRMLEDVLPQAILNSLKKLPIAKNMRWGNNDYHFVRPVHNLMILHGQQTLCTNSQILGLTPVNYTFGHRILSPGKIILSSANAYLEQLLHTGKVMAKFTQRKQYIQTQLEAKAKALKLILNTMPGLLDEVTALVEYPVVLQGEFQPKFLAVPQECLILSMAKNQKYFALLDHDNLLSNKFLFVANILSPQPEVIIAGNEKVLSARLSDAKFFYDMDNKHPLGDFVEKLANVVYHNKLGSQLQRIVRLQNIALQMAKLLDLSPELATHTAYLLKADLTTEMVTEFPELQGVMGRYYALNQGEKAEVANAIEQHYFPRFSGDKLPTTPLATAMSLTDKLETLVGIWGSGLIPSGDKDPFALRRLALGVVRILLETPLNLKRLLELTFSTFAELNLNLNTSEEVYQFIQQRLYHYLTIEKKYTSNCVQSILALNPSQFAYIPSLLDKLQDFAINPANQPLLIANKRIENILKKTLKVEIKSIVTEALFQDEAEKNLSKLLKQLENNILHYALTSDWNNYFSSLAKFNLPVTAFFDNVMVMDENLELRNNRLALLQKLYALLNQYCKLSELD